MSGEEYAMLKNSAERSSFAAYIMASGFGEIKYNYCVLELAIN
jgi:hypothetical protein